MRKSLRFSVAACVLAAAAVLAGCSGGDGPVGPGSGSGLPCGGALGAHAWNGEITYDYSQSATFDETTVQVHEHGSLQVHLVGSAGAWSTTVSGGTLGGTASATSTITTRAPDGTLHVTTYSGSDGAPILVQDGLNVSGVVLTIDPQTCTYKVEAVAWRPVTVTETGLAPYTGPSSVGGLRIGGRKANGTGTLSGSASLPGHSPGWPEESLDAYFPTGGFPPGVLLFSDIQTAVGSAPVSWSIKPE